MFILTSRRGVGSGILVRLEQLALGHGVEELRLDSSLNAEAFYQRHGYEVVERGVHRLGTGREMAAIKMKKRLLSR
jgi:putative acetyltransferase